MDWGRISEYLHIYTQRYKYFILIIAVGILLISLPENRKTVPQVETDKESSNNDDSLQNELEEILKCLSGAGEVKVLLTKESGEEILYQTNESSNNSDTYKTDTVLVNDAQRIQTGLIRQIISPKYQGAVILCTGAGSPDVCLAVSKAVSSVTGLSFDKITVLKLKGSGGIS